ncbi:MAG: hypothetical protein ACE5I8_02095 [Thermodesulfobacteriota bacterium]
MIATTDFVIDLITLIYRVMVGYFAVVLIWNMLQSENWREHWREQLLGAIVIIPLILRFLHIK